MQVTTATALPIQRSVLLLHLDYTAWATGRLLESCKGLTTEEATRDLQSSHGGITSTMRHIYYADRIWLSRLEGESRDFRDQEPEPGLDDLQVRWPELLTRFREFVAGMSDEALASDLHYRNLKGDPFTMPRWKVLLHVVNHATLHRGQVMAMFRQIGKQPPATDLIFFYLQAK
jgi:uncharacterized damage-inducible protein DinB